MPPESDQGHNSAETHNTPRVVHALASLQFKATILVVALTLCVTAVVSGYLLQSSIRLSRAQQAQELVNTAGLLARAVAMSVASEDRNAVKTLLNDVVQSDPLIFAIVSDFRGRELALASRPEHIETLKDARAQRPDDSEPLGVPKVELASGGTEDHLEILFPIALNYLGRAPATQPANAPNLVGYLRAGMATNRWNQAMASKLDLVIGVGTIATCMAIFLGFLLIRRIVSPLDGLATTMLEFSRGNLDARSNVRRNDEIGQLSKAFNLMADEHQQTLERLVHLNAELEDRVVQRTRQLEELASRDPLTGIYNRRHFTEMLSRHFAQAIRYDHDLAYLMIDLDDFKQINDQMGHHSGDVVLKGVANAISQQLRDADVCARYGGDEFVVLLPQTNVERASALGERILGAINDQFATEPDGLSLTASIGVASVKSSHATNAEDLMRCADRAMYQAKRKGKGRLVHGAPLLPTPQS